VSLLKPLLEDLAEQRTFRFEEPWRLSSKALGLAVPIVRAEYGERTYLVLDEIPGGVDIRDSGEIRRLIAKSGVDKPVFIRGGVLVKGETQPRAIRFGVVVLPGEERPIEAFCVHDVRPIRTGARMAMARDIPIELAASLVEGDQAEIWDRIRARAHRIARRVGAERAAPVIVEELPRGVLPARYFHARYTLPTDLIAIEEALEEADRRIKDVIERFPLIKDQVGVAVLDAKGVFAMELFDHPDSWSAIAKNAGRKFAEVLAEEGDYEVFKPDKEGIAQAIRAFIEKLGACDEREVFKNKVAKTFLLKGEDVYGEYTVLEGSVIHLMAVRAEERFRPYIRMAERFFEAARARRGGRLARIARFFRGRRAGEAEVR